MFQTTPHRLRKPWRPRRSGRTLSFARTRPCRHGTISTCAFRTQNATCPLDVPTETASPRKSTSTPIVSASGNSTNGVQRAISPFSFISSRISTSLCHAATNVDRGGTCQKVDVVPAEPNLHFAWDDAAVVEMEQRLETHTPEATAQELERLYPVTSNPESWQPGSAERIAWESHRLAESAVYEPLGIPHRPCMPDSCDPSTSSTSEAESVLHGKGSAVRRAPTRKNRSEIGRATQRDLGAVNRS